jgi:hypothetical protein
MTLISPQRKDFVMMYGASWVEAGGKNLRMAISIRIGLLN